MFKNIFKALRAKPRQEEKVIPCKHCGSKKTENGFYTRGWNNLCQQADGDNGAWCPKCCKVTFARSLESYKASLPEWCVAWSK